MCQSCNSCGCGLASILNNLFGTGNNGCNCGCNNHCGCNNNFTNGFISGVNAANAAGRGSNNGCGCGSNADLSAYTACGNQCYDAYYAQQYALYPSCGCDLCGNGSGFTGYNYY